MAKNELPRVFIADYDGAAVARTVYEWRCPGCETVNRSEADPQGETHECTGCDARIYIRGTRTAEPDEGVQR